MNRTCKNEKCKQWVDAVAFLSPERGFCTHCEIESRLLAEIPKGSCVLDVGSGLGAYHKALDAHCGGDIAFLEAHLPYVVAHKLPVGLPALVGLAQDLLPALRDGVFDAVIAIDFIGQLVKDEAVFTIKEMQRLAPKVILFAPLGEHPQVHDRYHLGGEHWQTRRSSWSEADLAQLGFKVEVWRGYHGVDDKYPDAMWATWTRP